MLAIQENFLTLVQAAKAAGMSRQAMGRKISKGIVPAVWIAGRPHILPVDVFRRGKPGRTPKPRK